jgi:hypothetical protein
MKYVTVSVAVFALINIVLAALPRSGVPALNFIDYRVFLKIIKRPPHCLTCILDAHRPGHQLYKLGFSWFLSVVKANAGILI